MGTTTSFDDRPEWQEVKIVGAKFDNSSQNVVDDILDIYPHAPIYWGDVKNRIPLVKDATHLFVTVNYRDTVVTIPFFLGSDSVGDDEPFPCRDPPIVTVVPDKVHLIHTIDGNTYQDDVTKRWGTLHLTAGFSQDAFRYQAWSFLQDWSDDPEATLVFFADNRCASLEIFTARYQDYETYCQKTS